MGLFDKFFKKGKASNTDTKDFSGIKGIDLVKKRTELVTKISLEKNISLEQKSRVALVLDYSYSMDFLYDNGSVQELLERLIPLGMRFDDNEAIDLFIFHNTAHYVGEVNINNFSDYIKTALKGFSYGGTEYSPIIDLVTEKYTKEKGDVAYVMFVTDGDCSDKFKSMKSILKASNEAIFWQFIGIGDAWFGFLRDMDGLADRFIDNANFFQANNAKAMTDAELYNNMMNEYPAYLKEAKSKGLI